MKRFGLHGPIENFRIICYNGWSLGNLKNGGSQGGYLIYLVRENGVFSPIIWKSKRLRRVVKSAMAAETLIQVEAAEACFWLANLLREMLYCKPNDDKNRKVECFIENHQLYDSFYFNRPMQDKRLRTEIALLREMTSKKEITKIKCLFVSVWFKNNSFWKVIGIAHSWFKRRKNKCIIPLELEAGQET